MPLSVNVGMSRPQNGNGNGRAHRNGGSMTHFPDATTEASPPIG